MNIEVMNADCIQSDENLESLDPKQVDTQHLDQESQSSESEETVSSTAEEISSSSNTPKKHFEKFLSDLALVTDVEKKLQFAIDFMEMSIAQTGTPHFKSFWEARTVCLELFKENINPVVRAPLWAKYNELSKEARRLKDILDEQSAFAVEQIEIAVTALEATIAENQAQVEKMTPIDFGPLNNILAENISKYQEWQLMLNLLNTQASRINALRKELIRTEMRVRQKNKFFQRLSAIGDSVFPIRKDLIKQISDQFSKDVDTFIEKDFKNENRDQTLSQLREEIKALQNIAKMLTLNTQSFTHTRMHLSECWDLLKGKEKERKKERTEQRLLFKTNFDEAMQRLSSCKEGYEAGTTPFPETKLQIDAMGVDFSRLELDRADRYALKEAFLEMRQILLNKTQAEENERLEKQNEKELLRRQKIVSLKENVEQLVKEGSLLDLEVLITRRDELMILMGTLTINKLEKNELERQLKTLKDVISEKKEMSLLSLSDDDRNSLQNLREVLAQRKERRQAIKNQLDQYKKSISHSGLDFEQAMTIDQQIAEEKERLEKINESIREIETKIAELGA